MLNIFEQLESQVRSYCRSFPVEFASATGSLLYDVDGREYIDLFAGAGALNYGHNHPAMKKAIVEYLAGDGVIHGLDMFTSAKRRFLEKLSSVILQPRNLNYKVQFVGPTGANAIEAALKLARMVKKRANIVAFTNGYHGLSAGALSVSANSFYRNEAFIQRSNVVFMPFDGYLGKNFDTVEVLRKYLLDTGSGVDLPSAVVVETIQAEGGVNVASAAWMKRLAELCREFDILLIVDDIQVGCGRSGPFFSFDELGIQPDIVTLSKSISGFGLPMSLVLLRPEIDQWKPGEHTGTFRGNNLAFVTATEALRFWETDAFCEGIKERSHQLQRDLGLLAAAFPEEIIDVRGRGLIFGVELAKPELAKLVINELFRRGVILELGGAKRNTLKFLPALTIEPRLLAEAGNRLRESLGSAIKRLQDPK